MKGLGFHPTAVVIIWPGMQPVMVFLMEEFSLDNPGKCGQSCPNYNTVHWAVETHITCLVT